MPARRQPVITWNKSKTYQSLMVTSEKCVDENLNIAAFSTDI